MARQPRLEIPGGLYHVTNRGVERGNIVINDDDRRTWLRLLDRVATRCRWRVFAYVLLDNHFHLYFRLTDPNLSAGMHDLESGYATLFNKNHDRSGHLFQARFHAVIVENDSHSVELTRYIHLNPVRAGIVQQPLQFRWSSYRYYLNPRDVPDWLDWTAVLAQLARRESAARVAYKRFVDAGMNGKCSNPLADVVDDWILGSPDFASKCRDLLAEQSPPRERIPLDRIVTVVCRRFGVEGESVRQRGRHRNQARDAAILIARDLRDEPLESLAVEFGGVSRSAISETARRARERIEREPAFRKTIEEIKNEL